MNLLYLIESKSGVVNIVIFDKIYKSFATVKVLLESTHFTLFFLITREGIYSILGFLQVNKKDYKSKNDYISTCISTAAKDSDINVFIEVRFNFC